MMKLTLHVFYASMGFYQSALTAAQELAAERPELELRSWDVFAAPAAEMREHHIHSYPTVRFFADGVLCGDSTQVNWGKPSLARWIYEGLKQLYPARKEM